MRRVTGWLMILGSGVVIPTAILWLLGAPIWAWPAVVAAVCAVGLVVALLIWVDDTFDVPWHWVSIAVYIIAMTQITGFFMGLPWYFLIQWAGIALLVVVCVVALLCMFFAGWERVFGLDKD